MTTRSRVGIVKPNPKYALSVITPSTPPEPKSVKVALRDPSWHAAMKDEMHALHHNNTWTLVPRQPGMNVIGCRWIFKTKLHSDGSLERLKARLVAKGYNQREGVDFLETFSPVIRPATIHTVLTLATVKGWSLRQLDVKNAFLHGYLDTAVFMDQPPGFADSTLPHHVCKLQRALYGLKQAPRAWFDRFSTFLIDYGFLCSSADSSLFVFNTGKHTLILLVYVDDIILTGSCSTLLAAFSKYMSDLLHHTTMLDCKPVATPMASKQPCVADPDSPYKDVTEYRQIVGTLQYLTLTWPDLSYAVNSVCQYMHAPTNAHYQMVKRILRYVKGTLSLGVRILRESSLDLYAFSDADWAGCPTTRCSTTGFCTFLGSNCISWSAKKQPTVSRSSTEAEYRAMASTAAELTWISFILRDIGVSQAQPPVLFCDNLSALHMSVNPVLHARTKHIAIDYHFVREKVALGSLLTRFVPSSLQIADLFTKPLSRAVFDGLKTKLGLWDTPTPSLKGDKEADKKQPTVSRSSTEAEYRAMASTAAELTWISFILRDIGVSQAQPPVLFCDNLSALHMSVNPVLHARTKHIAIDYHFVREKVALGSLLTRFVPSSLQIADLFTKPLSRAVFDGLKTKLGLWDTPTPSLKGDKEADKSN
uniref:Reverse transcriptase Ty1/copia-type domain-containing protein n=1 Tax=Fagus sylvatica TaxID=28930 RepID=A0A2N9GS34_FAGSY